MMKVGAGGTAPRHLRHLLALCLWGWMALAAAAPPTSLRVVLDDNYPPYSFRDAQGAPQGLLKDLWTLWAERTGVAVDFQPQEWGQALMQMARGEADVIDTIFKTESRQKIYAFSEPYARIEVSLFFHQSISGIVDAESARGFTIGVKKGDACAEFLTARGIEEPHELRSYPDYVSQVQAAARQEIRVLCIDHDPALYIMNRAGVAEQFRHTPPLYTGEFHWAVARDRPDLLQFVAAGFARITAEERAALESRWLGESAVYPGDHTDLRPAFYSLAALSLLIVILSLSSWLLRRQVAVRTRELNALFDNAYVGMLQLQNRRIVKCNQRLADMFGIADARTLVGQSTQIFYPSAAAWAAAGQQGYSQLATRGVAHFETEMRRQDGSVLWVIQSGRALVADKVLDALSLWAYTDITAQKSAEAALQQSQRLFQVAFDASPEAASIATLAEGRLIEVNDNYERDFGWTRNELLGRTSVEVGFWADAATRQTWLAALSIQERLLNYETRWIDKQGRGREVSISSRIIEVDGEKRIVSYVSDITARKKAEADLRIAAAAFESQEGMVVTDAESRILRVNRAFTAITGYSAEDVIGQTPRILRSNRHDAEFYRAMWDSIARTGGWQGEIWDRRKNGEVYPKWLTITAIKDAAGRVTHYIGTHHDITERKRAEERINDLAFYDQLTGLANRTLLLDRLRQILAASARSGHCGALLFIDLDNFKTLNDTQGHDVGDLLLKQAAQRLIERVREGDTVARLGGDEFVVVLSALPGDAKDAASDVEMIAGKILTALHHPYLLGTHHHHSSASIGVTIFNGDGVSIDELMKQADLAMYKSKEAGRNNVRFFDPALETAVQARAAWEGDLRLALERQQLVLHLQPQVTEENRITGAEALLRWQHPQRGMVSPATFIPLAEESGLILPMGQWVLDSACQQLVRWAADPAFAHLSIAVNVSARQFHQNNFVATVIETLKRSGANPERLKLELTESLLVENVQDIIDKMVALRGCGIGFALDDFGTGYSSLSYLKRLPLNQLKIDQSFVRDVLDDPNDAVIAKTIIALAQSLGLDVIAEGVESAAQRDFLRGAGCPAYQGYLFSRPLPFDQFESLVRQHPAG